MGTETDCKDEDNLELAWGWWLADKDYLEWLKTNKNWYYYGNKNERTLDNKQLELFENENIYNILANNMMRKKLDKITKQDNEDLENMETASEDSIHVDLQVIPLAEGCIMPNSEDGKKLGFTTNLFDGYLWKKDRDIYISFIMSLQQGKGNLRKLFENILNAGYNIKVPTPFPRMEMIIKKLGFIHTVESEDGFCDGAAVEVWTKQAV